MEKTLIQFSRFLAGHGHSITSSQVLDCVRAASIVGPGRPYELMAALRSSLTRSPREFSSFKKLFAEFFFAPPQTEKTLPPPRNAPGIGAGYRQEEVNEHPPSDSAPASVMEVLGRKGFSKLDPAQAAQLAAEVQKILQPLARRMSRRKRSGGRAFLNWRATMRTSLKSGGELADLKYSRRKPKDRRLMVLADVSGSMDIAAPYIFSFLQGLGQARRQMEVFVFATRLTRATHWINRFEARELALRLPDLVPDLAGGTRMGQALFNMFQGYGPQLGPNTVAMIISDGWDRGDPELLARQMARLHRQCRRVLWLNPLLESPRYEPINRGMKAALPYVDHLLACHNLESLKKAAAILDRAIK